MYKIEFEEMKKYLNSVTLFSLFSNVMEFPSDSELGSLQIFPFPESDVLEFKQSIDVSFPKILATLCAFLNTKGGHMVFGVRDTNREIVGMSGNVKHIDTFLLLIDNIFHSQLLTTYENGPITPQNIQVRVITAYNDKPIVVIRAIPDLDTQYKIKDGVMYYRLAASNYRIGASGLRIYTESDLLMRINELQKNITKEYSVLIRSLKNNLDTAQNSLHSLQQKNDETVSLLHSKILNEKTKYEEPKASPSFWSFLTCGLL